MAFAPKYSLEQWAEAQRLRGEGLSFGSIARRLGFNSPSSISTRARKDGWWGVADVGKANVAKDKSRASSPATVQVRRVLALRLYSLLELKIRMMELRMKKQLDAYEQSPAGAEPPELTKDERETFAALIESINQVTEMASEPASAADGRRKSVSLNPELTALSDDIDPDGLAAASEKDEQRAYLAQQLAKAVGPA